MQRQTRTVGPVVVISVALAVTIAIISIPFTRRQTLHVVTGASRPVVAASLNLLNQFGWSSAIHQSSDTESALRQQLASVSRELSDTRQQLEAQANAGRLADFVSRVHLPSVSATVIGYSPDPGIQSLIINAGHDQNLKAGQAVITDDGWMIGKIQSVHEATATVLLLTDAQSIVLARIQNAVGSQGVVHGERGLTLRLDLIPKNDQVTAGQPIVTSGLEPGLPPDLLIGTIAEVEQRSGEVFQRARMNVPIRYGRVRTVAVITL